MKYRTFSDQDYSTYDVAILAPKLERDSMAREYLEPINLSSDRVIAYQLYQDKTKKKTSKDLQKQYLDDLMPVLGDLQVTYLLVGEGDYFKTLTGAKKAEAMLGYVIPNIYPEDMAGQFNVIYVPNYRQVFYNPGPVRSKIEQGLHALRDHATGHYKVPGHDIIDLAEYPDTYAEIEDWLLALQKEDRPLTCDIEGFSLKHYDAGLGTITFCWNEHEGIAFPVDLGPEGAKVRGLLKKFFTKFNNTIIWHNASYDITVLIYQLWMDDITDTRGLLEGLEVMTKNFDDTKIIAYLATNTCAGNNLGLKDLSQEYTGNYAVEEIKDITRIPLPELLQYNVIDGMATWYVRNKYWDKMVEDEQLALYEELFRPALVDIIQMQLTGMCVDPDKVAFAKTEFEKDRNAALAVIRSHPVIAEFENMLNEEAEIERRQDWEDRKAAGVKVRPYTEGNFDLHFNPNSTPQKQRIFYERLALPVIEKTDSKQPSTSAETLGKLRAYTQDKSTLALLNAFLDYAAVDKLYGTFIPVLENAQKGRDGGWYIFGNFNLGGTVSGRLSSSDPNLQTIPSNNKHGKQYAKLIKDCFVAPPGWLMIGLDFASLEDRISALTTKDPNKLKVYTDGYDGHCLRAHAYFGDQMDGIDGSSVESINSIADRYPELRQDSKMPTFALTYQGTYLTLMAKGGFSETMARAIEANYHHLYRVSDEWVARQLDEASRTGYVTAAFGLRVRTPLLAQVVRGTSRTPREAEAEGRTAGNALGQSWCLLNTRASVEFMRKVRKSRFRYMIRPIAHIHDAQYFLIPDDIEVLMFVNKHLVKAVEWQEHPAIQHPEVKLGGKLALFYPSWAKETPIPNHANKNEILDLIAKKFTEPEKEAA